MILDKSALIAKIPGTLQVAREEGFVKDDESR